MLIMAASRILNIYKENMRKNQKGFSVVEIIIVLVLIGLVGTVIYLFIQNSGLKKDQQNTTQSTSQQQTVGDTQKTEATKSDPNAGYLVVKEWGLRFKMPSGLAEIRYTIHGDTAAFFAKPAGAGVQYRADYDKFEDSRSQYAIGVLYRSTDSAKSFMGDDKQGKKVGAYYYYTNWAFSSLASGASCVGLYGGDSESDCQTENKAFELVNTGDAALLNTIELAK